ncbi:MAG: chemotaxis protein CheD [Hyphomicrobiaceae bacterium]
MTANFLKERRIHIIQGEYFVADDPGVMLTTVLGSCVAACLRDPEAQVGGMNHFLLPDYSDRSDRADTERYGVHLMELLVNGLMQRGARRERLQAKLFGGARIMQGLSDIGAHNATFAERFLATEGIALIGGSLRGDCGRRIQYWPVSGRARQIFVKSDAIDPSTARSVPPSHTGSGDIELF